MNATDFASQSEKHFTESIDSSHWLNMLRNSWAECESVSDLLAASGLLNDFILFEDVVPHGVTSWRHRMGQLWPNRKGFSVGVCDLSEICHAAHSKDSSPSLCIRMIQNLKNALGVKCFVVACDGDNVWRYGNPMYKSDREERGAEFHQGLSEAKNLLKEEGWIVSEQPEYESDDIMSTIAYQCQLLSVPCVIASEDKDMWQSLGATTTIYNRKSTSYRNMEWLKATHSIAPRQVVDYLCLIGKNNLPGAKGIGPKTASKLLQAYGDVQGIWDCRDSLKPKQRENLQEFFGDTYRTVKELHTLSRSSGADWIRQYGRNRSKAAAAK